MRSQEILNKLKDVQLEKIKHMANISLDETDTITLYHGTSSTFLNDILTHGLQPRAVHGNSMYDENSNPSNEQLVYLTNFLHYRYAFSTTITNKGKVETETGIDFDTEENNPNIYETGYEKYYSQTGDVPMILTIDVPKSWLLFDEDIAYFNAFSRAFNQGEIDMNTIDWVYSMKQFTCASMKPIPPSFIKKVELVAYSNLDIVFHNMSRYACELSKWAHGLEISEDAMAEATEELRAYMYDMHLGAFEKFVPMPNETYNITYKDCCVYVEKMNRDA